MAGGQVNLFPLLTCLALVLALVLVLSLPANDSRSLVLTLTHFVVAFSSGVLDSGPGSGAGPGNPYDRVRDGGPGTRHANTVAMKRVPSPTVQSAAKEPPMTLRFAEEVDSKRLKTDFEQFVPKFKRTDARVDRCWPDVI